MFNDFLKFMHFLAFRYFHYKSSNTGRWGLCLLRVISKMEHALETRLPFYKWRYIQVFMQQCGNDESNALTRLAPYYIHISTIQLNIFNTSFKLQFNFTHNFDDLYIIVLDVQYLVYLKHVNPGGQSCLSQEPLIFFTSLSTKNTLGTAVQNSRIWKWNQNV